MVVAVVVVVVVVVVAAAAAAAAVVCSATAVLCVAVVVVDLSAVVALQTLGPQCQRTVSTLLAAVVAAAAVAVAPLLSAAGYCTAVQHPSAAVLGCDPAVRQGVRCPPTAGVVVVVQLVPAPLEIVLLSPLPMVARKHRGVQVLENPAGHQRETLLPSSPTPAV